MNLKFTDILVKDKDKKKTCCGWGLGQFIIIILLVLSKFIILFF